MTTMDEFQHQVAAWCVECFGKTIAQDGAERNWRFLEEALELVQSLGCSAQDAHHLVDYVFGREAGAPAQEVGGAIITLAALASANKLALGAEAVAELRRIDHPDVMNKIRRKHAGKPHKSPLPDDFKEKGPPL